MTWINLYSAGVIISLGDFCFAEKHEPWEQSDETGIRALLYPNLHFSRRQTYDMPSPKHEALSSHHNQTNLTDIQYIIYPMQLQQLDFLSYTVPWTRVSLSDFPLSHLC